MKINSYFFFAEIIFIDTYTSTPFADIDINTDKYICFLCFASPFPK